MRHRMGNTPHCIECYWYREKEAHDGCREDGWCTNTKHCAVGINGRKREHPPEREPVRWNHECRMWEDAECRLTHFEVCARTPEPWKSEEEQERVMAILQAEEHNGETS